MITSLISLDYDIIVSDDGGNLNNFLKVTEDSVESVRKENRIKVVEVYEKLREVDKFVEGLILRIREPKTNNNKREERNFRKDWTEILKTRVETIPIGQVSNIIHLFDYNSTSSEVELISMCLSWLKIGQENAGGIKNVIEGIIEKVEGGGIEEVVGALVGILGRCEFWCAGDGIGEKPAKSEATRLGIRINCDLTIRLR